MSSLEQQKEGYSSPARLRILHEYATNKGLTIVQEFTGGETAKPAGRTGFAQMPAFLESDPETIVVLVEKTDRLYRNLRDCVTVDGLNVEVHLVKGGEVVSRTSASHQKFIHGIKVLMAKNFIDDLSEETSKGSLFARADEPAARRDLSATVLESAPVKEGRVVPSSAGLRRDRRHGGREDAPAHPGAAGPL